MTTDKKNCRSSCPITFSLDLFGDKWSLLIVRDLVFSKRNSYGEFLEAGEGISTNILADRLKNLESDGIIQKSVDPHNKRKYIYALTPKGIELIPILVEIIRWGGKYDPESPVPTQLLDRIETDRETVINEFRSFINKPD